MPIVLLQHNCEILLKVFRAACEFAWSSWLLGIGAASHGQVVLLLYPCAMLIRNTPSV